MQILCRRSLGLQVALRCCQGGSEMVSTQSKGKFGGLILALFVLLGVSTISATTVQAQWRRDDQNRDRDYRRDRDRDRDDDRDDRDDRYDRRDRDYRNRNDRYRNWRNDGYYGRNGNYGYNVYQAALNQGFQAGLNTGASDAQRGQSYDPQRSHYYRNPPSYDSYNRGQSRQAFREGFVRGYAEGYRQYGGYNRNRGYSRFPFPW